MPRESIAMSRAEVLEFLAGQDWMLLATLEAGGAPTGEIVSCALEAERLFFGVDPDGRSARNLKRDPRACCANDRYPSYYEIQGVSVHGRARPEKDPAPARRLSLSGEIYSLALDDVLSFDFAKIRDKL
ncbi:MAG: pyridoxamine 5'-phosphate oxidase family protein [Proteobacteria bacterium]|nr:pyridoxamine 5'-phosphate oxidase family protein [Pseudomonadota bacterium]